MNKMKYVIASAIACLALASAGAAPVANAATVMPSPGFNLGNTLESTWGYTPPTKALIDSIHNAGFKTLRVPCAWNWNSTNGTVNPAYMTQVTNVVNWALADGMYVIINDHWDNGWFEDEPGGFNSYNPTLNSQLINLWTQVANNFKWFDSDKLSFACTNEPDAATQAQVSVLYEYYQNWINAMRANGGGNAVRWLVVQAPCPWNWTILLNYGMNMPVDSGNKLMIEEHTYDPGEFTVNSTDSPIPMTYFWGSAYHVSGSLSNRNASSGTEECYINTQFAKLQTNFENRGYPVLIGEWAGQPKPAEPDLTGSYINQNVASVTYYDKFMENTIASYGFSGTFFTGQGDLFDATTGAVLNQTKLNAVLGNSALPPVSGLGTNAPVTNGTYRLISRLDGQALDANGTADLTQIIQEPYTAATNQQWTVTNTGNGQYSIVGVQSGRALDIFNSETNDGAKVELYDNWGGNNQKFTFTPTDSGYFRISPVSSPNSCLDVTNISTAAGANIQQWTYWGGTGQQWGIVNP